VPGERAALTPTAARMKTRNAKKYENDIVM